MWVIVLEQQVSIVTGGGQGIGAAVARLLARAGAKVAVVDLNFEKAQLVAMEIGGRAFQADVTEQKQVENCVEEVATQMGEPQILVNNAGIVSSKPFLETTLQDFSQVLAVNLQGVYNCCHGILPYFVRQGSGKIVNIASIAGKRGGGVFGDTLYAASKAGVLGLTKGLAREFAPHGINVNAVCPGPVDTEMLSQFQGERREEFIRGNIPLGRLALPQDVANVVLFLVSPLAEFITGEVTDVDGGITMD